MKIIPVLAMTTADSCVFPGFVEHRGILLIFSEMFFSKYVNDNQKMSPKKNYNGI